MSKGKLNGKPLIFKLTHYQEIARLAFNRTCDADNGATIVLETALEYLETRMPEHEFINFCNQF